MPDTPETPTTPKAPAAIAIIIGVAAMILAKLFHVEIPIELQQQTADAAAKVIDVIPLIVSVITGIAVRFTAKPKQ